MNNKLKEYQLFLLILNKRVLNYCFIKMKSALILTLKKVNVNFPTKTKVNLTDFFILKILARSKFFTLGLTIYTL